MFHNIFGDSLDSIKAQWLVDHHEIIIPYRGFDILLKIYASHHRRGSLNEVTVLNSKKIDILPTILNMELGDKVVPRGDNLYKIYLLIDKYLDTISKNES